VYHLYHASKGISQSYSTSYMYEARREAYGSKQQELKKVVIRTDVFNEDQLSPFAGPA